MCHGSKVALPALTLSFAAAEFDVTVAAMGTVLSVYILGSAASSVPAGLLSDRLGPAKALVAYFWLTALAALACALAETYSAFLIAHALLGLAAGVFHPSALALVSLSVDRSRLGHAMGLFGVAGGLGWFSAPLLMRTSLGWRAGYLGLAAAGFIGALVCQLLVTRGYVMRGPSEETAASSPRGGAGRSVIVFLLAAMGVNAFLLDGFIPMFPEAVAALGTWIVEERTLVASVFAVGSIGQYVGGVLARDDFAASRYAVLMVLQPLALLGLAHSLDEPAWPYLLMGSYAFMNFMTQPIENKLMAAFTSARRRSTAYAFKFVVALLVAAPAPLLVSHLYGEGRWTFDAIFRLLALLGMLGVFAGYLFLKGTRQVPRRAA